MRRKPAASRLRGDAGAPAWCGWIAGLVLVGASGLAQAQVFPDFAGLVEKRGAAVVNISSSQRVNAAVRNADSPDSPNPDPGAGDGASLGSGLIISPDGYVLTCAHVVDNAREIRVRLGDRREYAARMIGADRRTDVALLKIDGKNLPRIVIGDPRRLRVGDWVLAIGSPFGFENSATAGIVSATGRTLADERYASFIQTDVPINPGNSGGPLFNLAGEVVGINSQILSRRNGGFLGLSFAIPIDVAVRVAGQLKERGYVRRGWLGVRLQEVTRDLAGAYGLPEARGALVADVLPGGPAAKSGLRQGDIILDYQGQPIGLSSELAPRVGVTEPGTSVRLGVFRRNQGRQSVAVTLGELSDTTIARAPAPEAAESTGLSLGSLSAGQRRKLQLERGVSVDGVDGGPARDAGLRVGDIILEVDGRPVATPDEALRLLRHTPGGRPAVLRVQRGPTIVFVALRADR
jgi:serine protease Do